METPMVKGQTLTPLSTPDWPKKREKEASSNRAKELWEVLRNSVKLLTTLMKKDDVKPSMITHGIHHQRKLNHDEPLQCVIYNSTSEEIITVDTQFIRVFYRDGRRKDIIDPGDDIVDMIWSSKSNKYIALTSEQQMKLLNSDLEFISTATFQHKISCMICNESCNEIVTAGCGNITSWCFRYGNKYLIPHRIITEGLSTTDKFDHVTLEGTASKTQKCYAAYGTGVAIFNLREGRLLCFKKDLHVRNITSILFINPLKYVVTGSRDGSIKLWDADFEVKHVFVGHHGPVQALSLYPLGPYFMSASYDSTIRLWSLETYDEVDLLETDEPNEGMNTVPDIGHLFSFSAYAVDLWSISHIHQVFTTIKHDVFKMQLVSLSKIPERVITLSSDNIVRIVSPTNGSVVTSLVPFHRFPSSKSKKRDANSVKGKLVDAVYCLPKETIYAIYSDGTLIKAWTRTNPATVQKVWKYDEDEYINCMCVYENVLNITELRNTWRESQELPKLPKLLVRRRHKYGNKTLLLAGRKDGCIANIDMMTGDILYKTEAHGSKGVIGLLANTKSNQIISAGEDNVVKVWRIFPNTAEALSLLMSFYCAHTPRHMSIVLSNLVVAFQQPETATYSIVVYDLETKERFDHSPDQDHTDSMTGLTCCARLKLFASSSKDGTIRVWNHFNILIRTLKLNAEPKSIQFCSQRGDLLVGLGGNIHRIEHQNYLPQAYIFKMVCMEFTDQIKERPIGFDETLTKNLSSDVLRCIKGAKSSYMKFDYAWDPMSPDELNELNEGEQKRLKAYGRIARREKELSGIRDGTVEPERRLRKATKRTEARAFRKYMELFWRRQRKMIIAEPDDFSPDPPVEKPQTPQEWHEEQKTGFFPPISAVKPFKEIMDASKEMDKEKHFTESGPDYEPASKYIVNPTGFIPNSILAKFLWLQEDVQKQKEEIFKLPEFSEEQLAEINKRKDDFDDITNLFFNMEAPLLSLGKRTSAADIPEFEFNLATPTDSGSLIEENEDREWDVDPEDDDIIGPSAGGGPAKPKKVERKPSMLMEKLRSAMKTPPPKDPEPETPPPTAGPPKIQQSSGPKVKPLAKPTKPIVKLVSKAPPPPKPVPPPVAVVHSPTPPPTPPRPATPAPNFVTQFEKTAWFEKYKEYIFQRVRKPYVAGQFCNVISDVIGIASDWTLRKSAVDAMLLLWQQEDITDTRHIVTAINLILNSTRPPTSKDPDQAAFMRSALKFLQAVVGLNEDFILELIAQYLEGEATHKNFIKNILLQLGMRDSHNYFGKELETWEIWNLNETIPIKAQIKELARKWIIEWTEKFKTHLEQVMEELKKGDLKATIRKPPDTPHGVLKTGGSSRASTQRGTPRVHFTIQATEQTLQNLTPMEVINYFCEMSLEQELDKVKGKDSKPKPAKNTVLVLPKLDGPQALVRLGEMHTAHRARNRQELAAEYKLNPLNRPYPDLMAGFASKIILPLSTMLMNPFPSPIDRYELENVYQPVLLTLRSVHQRYFIPERSYVHLS